MNLLCPLKVVTFHHLQSNHDYGTKRLLRVLPSNNVTHMKPSLLSVEHDGDALDLATTNYTVQRYKRIKTHRFEYFETPQCTTL